MGGGNQGYQNSSPSNCLQGCSRRVVCKTSHIRPLYSTTDADSLQSDPYFSVPSAGRQVTFEENRRRGFTLLRPTRSRRRAFHVADGFSKQDRESCDRHSLKD